MYFKRNVLKLCKFQAPVFVSVLIQTALQSATSKQAATGYQKKKKKKTPTEKHIIGKKEQLYR